MTGWTHSARIVIENKSGIFTDEEVNAVKDAWKEAQRANYFALIVEMVGDEKASKKLPPTQQQAAIKMERDRERQTQDMLEYAARRDPELARQIQRMEWERVQRERPPIEMWKSDHTGPTNWR